MQRKVYLKEKNANYYLMYILEVCFWFGVHHSLIRLNISVAINVCQLCFWVANCTLQWLNFLSPLFSKKLNMFKMSVFSSFISCIQKAHKLHSSLSNYNCLLKITINIIYISPEKKQFRMVFFLSKHNLDYLHLKQDHKVSGCAVCPE